MHFWSFMAGGLVFVLVFIGIDYALERVADGDWPKKTYKLRILKGD